MSHFTVAVILDVTNSYASQNQTCGKLLKDLLAPYQENNIGNCPKEYLEFTDVTEECMRDYASESEEIKTKYPTFEKYMDEYLGYEKDEETGKYGYWENPNKKWDWWTVGGRWENMLTVNIPGVGKPTHVNAAYIKDIDWDAMRLKDIENFKKRWDDAQEEENEKMKRFMYDIREGETKEQYVKRKSVFSTFAVVTPDGKWYEKGKEEDEWDEKYKERFIDTANPENIICIVDCHI